MASAQAGYAMRRCESARLAPRARFLGARSLRRLLALDRQQHLPLPFHALAALLRLRRRRTLGLHAAPQRIHEIDDVARRGDMLFGLRWLEAGLLLAQQLHQCRLVVVLERRRVEVTGLRIQDVLGELQHFARYFDVLDVAEVFLRLAHLVAVAQRRPQHALAARLQGDDALALGEHDAAERDHTLAAHGVADDCERFLPNVVGRRDVIGAIVEALVDLRRGDEAVDVDGVPALHLDGLELVDLDVDAFVDFVAPALVLGRDRLARLVIDQLLAQAVAGFLVDLPKRDALRRRRGGTDRDGARDQRKLEIALPICTRRHGNTPA